MYSFLFLRKLLSKASKSFFFQNIQNSQIFLDVKINYAVSKKYLINLALELLR